MYTHVIFDLDGTLLDTIRDIANAGNFLCEKKGWPTHTVEAYKLMFGGGLGRMIRAFAPDGVSEEDLSDAQKLFTAYFHQHSEDEAGPYDGIPETIALLKEAGIRIAVLTNKPNEMAAASIGRFFPGVFEYVRGSVPGVPVKPDPTGLLALMESMDAPPETTIFVGDTAADIQAGKNAGVSVCGVSWGFRPRAILEEAGADYIVDDPAAIVKLVTGTTLLAAEETDRAADLLTEGKLVALPTETVYGLAANAALEGAVQANYDAKGRPETKPLNVLVDSMSMVEEICQDIPADSYKLAEAFWPGPLTMILHGNGTLPPIVPAGGATQGVRCPDHPATLEVIRKLGKPLACPSANRSGDTSPKSAGAVLEQLGGRIDAVLDGGACAVGVESTILDMTVKPYRILRQGGLSKAEIELVLGMEVSL